MSHRLEAARRRGVTLLVTAAAVALACPVAGPPDAARADPSTLAQIEKAVGVDDIPADYVIMADTSASMQAGNRYAGLRTSLRAFFAALAPADQLTLITFDSKARVVYQGQVGRSPDTLIGKLPATATGKATDIGAALEQATEALGRSGAPSIASVVLVTDGRHEPPAGSPYPLTDGYGWQQLHRRVEQMSKQSLRAYALPLSGATGASLLGSVFERPTTLNASSIGQVTKLLAVPKDDARKAKLRGALAGEQGRGLTVEWPAELARLSPGDHKVTLTVRSTTSKIPQDLANIAVTSSNPSVHVRLTSTSVSVPAGRTAQVPAVVSWDAGPRSLKYRDPVSADTGLRLSATASSPWTATLAQDLAIGFQPALGGIEVTGHGSANLGRPWVYYLAALLIVALVGLTGRGLYLRPSLYGVLLVDPPQGGAGHRITLSGRGRRATLGRAETGEDTPIRTGVVREGGAKRLRVQVNDTTMVLRPSAGRVLRGVGFEWLDGSQPARPATPQQPASVLKVPPSATGATTQFRTPTQPPVPSAPVTPAPAPAVPHWPPAPAPAAPSAPPQPAPAPRATPAPPPAPIDPDGDDELPVIDEQIARIE